MLAKKRKRRKHYSLASIYAGCNSNNNQNNKKRKYKFGGIIQA